MVQWSCFGKRALGRQMTSNCACRPSTGVGWHEQRRSFYCFQFAAARYFARLLREFLLRPILLPLMLLQLQLLLL